MKNITIILPSLLTVPAVKGGAVEQLLENFIIENEKMNNYNITLIAHYCKGVEQKISEFRYTNFKHIKFPSLLIRINSVLSRKLQLPNLYSKLLMKKFSETKNDIVLIEGSFGASIALKRKYPNYKFFLHYHGPSIITDKDSLNTLNEFEKIIVVSEYCRHNLLSQGFSGEKVVCLRNGIQYSNFNIDKVQLSRKQILEKYNIPDVDFIFLFKGRIVREKGIMELLEAFSKIENANVALLLVGSKNFGDSRNVKDKYEKAVYEKIQNDKRVFPLGFINNQNIVELHKIANLAVIPSIWDEPAGLVLIEAMASGLPVLCTRSGGMPEYSEPSSTIMIDKEKEVVIDNLFNAMNHILNDKGVLCEMKENANKTEKQYTSERYYENLCNILNQCD